MEPPPRLDELAATVAEAEEYERLQRERQRGVHDLLAGLPGLFLALWAMGGSLALSLIWFALFLVASFAPKMLLPIVRRARPDWEAPVLDASVLKRSLESLFWFQLAFVFGGAFLLTIVMMASIFATWGSPDTMGYVVPVFFGFMLALQAAATLTLAWRARRVRNGLMQAGFWAAGAVSAALLVISAPTAHQAPWLPGIQLFAFSVVAPPVLAGLFRLLAPRRWLLA